MPLYRFYIHNSDIPAFEVTPINADGLKVSIERDGQRYREKCNEKVLLGNNTATADWTNLYTYLNGNKCKDIYFTIRRACRAESDWITTKFTWFNCEIDYDRCIISIQPTTIDLYTCVFENWKKDVNILEVATTYDAEYTPCENIQTEEVTDDITFTDQVTSGSATDFDWVFNPSTSAPGFWKSEMAVLVPLDAGWCSGLGWSQNYFNINSISDFTVTHVIGNIYNISVDMNVTAGWVRRYIDIASISAPASIPGWCKDSDDGVTTRFVTNPEIYPVTSKSGTTSFTNGGGETINWTYSNAYAPPTTSTITLERFRSLNEVMQHLIDSTGCGYTWFSQLLEDTTYPMDGASDNPYCNMLIGQKSDYIYPIPTSPATRGVITLEKMLKYLSQFFNGDWYCYTSGGVNYLRFEHKKYFENGLQYTGTQTVNINVAADYGDEYVTLTNRITIDGNDKPGLWKYSNVDGFNYGFVAWPIEYDSCNIDRTGEVNTDIPEIATDIENVYNNPQGEVSKSGFLLVATTLTGGVYVIENFTPITAYGDSSNAYMSWYELHHRFFRHGCVTEPVIINTYDTLAASWMKLNKQVPVSFPHCCNTINYYELIRTELGDGEIASATWSLRDGFLTVNLIYN